MNEIGIKVWSQELTAAFQRVDVLQTGHVVNGTFCK